MSRPFSSLLFRVEKFGLKPGDKLAFSSLLFREAFREAIKNLQV